jgi:L-asparaginase
MLLITTGGTIDMHYDTKQQMIAPLRHSAVPDFLSSHRIAYDHHALCLKDARDIDEYDLQQLVQTIQTTTHSHILITHGYQTMSDTMRYIKDMRGPERI